ncbi:hypothetical protein DFH27DRAFT_69825 [Peziza echinospora]|nr:hypothetical protein DFH27DRAFT_69825 [Peziza echinospora]
MMSGSMRRSQSQSARSHRNVGEVMVLGMGREYHANGGFDLEGSHRMSGAHLQLPPQRRRTAGPGVEYQYYQHHQQQHQQQQEYDQRSHRAFRERESGNIRQQNQHRDKHHRERQHREHITHQAPTAPTPPTNHTVGSTISNPTSGSNVSGDSRNTSGGVTVPPLPPMPMGHQPAFSTYSLHLANTNANTPSATTTTLQTNGNGPDGQASSTTGSTTTTPATNPLLELDTLKFIPKLNSAREHVKKFDKLVGVAFPGASDAGKWGLFTKTLDTVPAPHASGGGGNGGSGTTPIRWVADLSRKGFKEKTGRLQ